MPYRWEHTHRDSALQTAQEAAELHLWPHQSLTSRGFAVFMASFFLLALIPFFGLLGTALLWALLPFMLAAVAALWVAIRSNGRNRQILEVLTLSPESVRLIRHNPRGPAQDWETNPYWLRIDMHERGGPVPYYVTMSGSGREVEIGAFLSEDERKALFAELNDRVRVLTRI